MRKFIFFLVGFVFVSLFKTTSFAIYEPMSLGMRKIELPYDYVPFFLIDYNNLNPENGCDTNNKCLGGVTGLSGFPYGPFGSLAVAFGFNADYYLNYRNTASNYYYDVGKKGKPLGINGPAFYTSDGKDASPVTSASTTQLVTSSCKKDDGASCYGIKKCSRKSFSACASDGSVSFLCRGSSTSCVPSDTIDSWNKADVPAYADSGSWWNEWYGILKELGNNFKNDPMVQFSVITYGVDGERPCTKNDAFVCPSTFNNYKNKTIAAFYDFWKKSDGTMKPVMSQGTNLDDALFSASYNPPMGMRNGLYVEDTRGVFYGIGSNGKSYGYVENVRNFAWRIPTAIEPK